MVALAIAAIGVGIAGYGAVSSSQASKKASKLSRQAEQVRKEQLTLDSARQRRQVARNAAQARANALAAGVASGGAIDGTSRIEGVQAGLTSQEGEQLNTIDRAEELGFSLFNINQALSTARSDVATGNAIQNFGVSLLGNAQTISNVGTSAYNYFSPPQQNVTYYNGR